MASPHRSRSIPRIELKPLRDHVVVRFDAWVKQTPDHEAVLRLLQEKALGILAGESATFDQIQEKLEAIVQAADILDDGHAFAASQQITNELDARVRAALSAGVPVFPEVAVKLSIPKSGSHSGGNRETKQGSRTKMGGKPDWVQSDATPICADCQKGMTFVAQIDSVAYEDTRLGQFLTQKDSFMFADVGMIYVFWCSGCNGTSSVLQCC